jgi:hypothetical protein
MLLLENTDEPLKNRLSLITQENDKNADEINMSMVDWIS